MNLAVIRSVMGLVALVPVAALAGVIDDLIASRERLPSIRAWYREELRVVSPPEVSEGATLGWGARDSDIELECVVSRSNSSLKYPPISNDRPFEGGGKVEYANEAFRSYDLIEGGMRGNFGKRPTGKLNPLVAGYDVNGTTIQRLARDYDLVSAADSSLTFDDQWANRTIKWTKFGNQTIIREFVSTGGLYSVRMTITDWFQHEGARFPKRISVLVDKGTSPFQRFQYTLIRWERATPQDALPTFKEGGLVKDADKQVLYTVRGGKLVLDPMSGTQGHPMAIRRLAILTSVLLIVVWAAARARQYMSTRRSEV